MTQVTDNRIAVQLTREQIDRAGHWDNECLGAQACMDHFKTKNISCRISYITIDYRDYIFDDEMISIIDAWFDYQDPTKVEPRIFYLTPVHP